MKKPVELVLRWYVKMPDGRQLVVYAKTKPEAYRKVARAVDPAIPKEIWWSGVSVKEDGSIDYGDQGSHLVEDRAPARETRA